MSCEFTFMGSTYQSMRSVECNPKDVNGSNSLSATSTDYDIITLFKPYKTGVAGYIIGDADAPVKVRFYKFGVGTFSTFSLANTSIEISSDGKTWTFSDSIREEYTTQKGYIVGQCKCRLP